jgi:hypothetical protein
MAHNQSLFLSRRNVRFGSKADICGATAHVRFTPNSDRESGFPHKVMSALHPKADMCSALAHVCFGPIADIQEKGRANRKTAFAAVSPKSDQVQFGPRNYWSAFAPLLSMPTPGCFSPFLTSAASISV